MRLGSFFYLFQQLQKRVATARGQTQLQATEVAQQAEHGLSHGQSTWQLAKRAIRGYWVKLAAKMTRLQLLKDFLLVLSDSWCYGLSLSTK